jgi:AcrR family transcriptional regulator
MKKAISIRNPVQKRSINTKEKILDAAYQLFCKRGYYQTTTNDIAKEAEVSIGSLYAYFKDKDTIFMEILERYSKDFAKIHKDLSEDLEISRLSWHDWLKLLIDRLIEMHEMTSELNQEINILCYTKPEVKAHVEQQRNASRQLAMNRLLQGREDLRVTDIEAAAIIAYNLITTTVDQVAFQNDLLERERMIAATMDALESYLLK